MPLQVLGPNVLRDSTLQRLELRHFEAYIHVNSIMWVICFDELRNLTNGNAFKLNPLQLNALYEQMWDMGTLLQGDRSTSVLEPAYRPWRRPNINSPEVEAALRALDDRRPNRLAILRKYRTKSDLEEYVLVLKKVLRLFGEAVHESLTRTMGDYLEATNGAKTNASFEDWELQRATKLKATNNDAERPFAVIKALWKQFPSMRLHNLTYLANAKVNGTFQEGGVYANCHPKVKAALPKLCCVRRKTPGAITKMRREHLIEDKRKMSSQIKFHEKEKQETSERLLAVRAAKKDAAFETELVASLSTFNLQLRSHTTKGAQLQFLKKEFIGRTGRFGNDYNQNVIGNVYRQKNRDPKGYPKLKMSPTPPDTRDQQIYLRDLLRLMVSEDQARNCTALSDRDEIMVEREVPMISVANTSAHSVNVKAENKVRLYEAAKPKDDPVLLELERKYPKGTLLYEFDAKKSKRKTYVVVEIASDNKGVPKGPGYYWEATCVEAQLHEDGSWAPAVTAYIHGEGDEKILDPAQLQGFELVCVRNPNQPNPHALYFDEYIEAHIKREKERLSSCLPPPPKRVKLKVR